MVRYWLAALGAGAAFVAVYVLFVRTWTGQTWENAVLPGRSSASEAELRTADTRLDLITVETLAAAVPLVMVIGFLRQRFLLGLGAAGVVCGALFLAEILGHTTIAVALMFSLIMGVPYGIRPWVALAVAAWGVGISGYTVTAGWPSMVRRRLATRSGRRCSWSSSPAS